MSGKPAAQPSPAALVQPLNLCAGTRRTRRPASLVPFVSFCKNLPLVFERCLHTIPSVPNKRAKNKVLFGGFIDRRFKAAIQKAASKAGMGNNVFGFAMAQALAAPRSDRRPL